MPPEDALPDPAALLEQVLNPLLDDFAASFERGLLLLRGRPLFANTDAGARNTKQPPFAALHGKLLGRDAAGWTHY